MAGTRRTTDDLIRDLLAGKTRRERLVFRFYFWKAKRIDHPRRQRRWDRAMKVIRDEDFYVISDHDFYRGVKARLWPEQYDTHGFPIVVPVPPATVPCPKCGREFAGVCAVNALMCPMIDG